MGLYLHHLHVNTLAFRHDQYEAGHLTWESDGINSLNYQLRGIDVEPLFTRIDVKLNDPDLCKCEGD